MTYTLDFSLALGSSKTGLTMACQLVDTSGANVGSEVTTGFTEIGQGYYLWNYASIPDAHRGGVKFYEDGVAGTILAFAAINPEEAEYTDASVQTVDTNVDSILDDTGSAGVVLANGALSAAKIGGDAITSAKIADDAIDAGAIATDAIDAAALKADAVTEIQSGLSTYTPSTDTVEGALTYDELLRIMLAVLAGISTGGGSTDIAFRNIADDADRVSATVDSEGNRDAITLDGS